MISNDAHLYDPEAGLACLIDRAEVRLVNQTSSMSHLHKALGDLNLADEQRLRPNWDQYFMQLASLAAQRSNCMKRRVGCVLIREKRVISTGYNGTPRNLKNCNEGGCKSLSIFKNTLLIAFRCKVQLWSLCWCWLINMFVHPCRGERVAGGWSRPDTGRSHSLL